MALPKLEAPKFNVTIPSSGENIEYRPYLVKEEKMLLLAMESNDEKQIMTAMTDLINVCTFNKVDAKKLPVFDIEYLFLKLRAKSVGETAALSLQCTKEGCEARTEVDVNMDLIEVMMPEKIQNKIEITDEVGMVLKFPTLATISTKKRNNQVDQMIDVLVACIDYIYDANDVYNASDETHESLVEFVESLNSDQFKKVQGFFENSPKVSTDVEWKCIECGHENSLKLEGLQSFFG